MTVLFQCHNEDPEKDKTPQNCRERDLEQVARKLEMAHEEIRSLTYELQGKEKVQSKLGKLWWQMNISDHVLHVMVLLRVKHKYTEKINLLR